MTKWAIYFVITFSGGGSFSGTYNAPSIEECVAHAVEEYREFQTKDANHEAAIFNVMCIPYVKKD
jgi:hypothetical protein